MGKRNHKAAPYMCGQCKQGFMHEKAVRDHIADKHRTIHGCGVFRCIDRVDGPDHDPEPFRGELSMAERSIAAELDVAMGERTDDLWLIGGA